MWEKVFTLLVVLLIALPAAAFPPIPEAYRGVAYLNGSLAKKVTLVKVVSASGMEFTTTVADEKGMYALDITFDDIETANVKEGAAQGEAVTWYVGGIKASQPASGSDSANSGGVNIDFTVSAGSGGSSCSDGVRNQGEEGVDCGGPCKSCKAAKTSTTVRQATSTLSAGSPTTTAKSAETTLSPSGDGTKSAGSHGSSGEPLPASCSDGIKNTGEEGVDCGGPCKSCSGSSSLLLFAVLGVGVLVVFGVLAAVGAFFFIKLRRGGGGK